MKRVKKYVNPRNYWFQSNSHYGIEKAVCWLTVVVPLLFRCFAPQNRTEESVLSSGLFCCVQSGLPDDRSPRTKQSAWAFFGSERRLIMGKVSGKTHTKEQLDHWAICIIPITRHIKLTLTIGPIRWIRTTDRTRKLTMRTAEIKHIGCPSGRLTIRNTMIKIGGARYVKVHFWLRWRRLRHEHFG